MKNSSFGDDKYDAWSFQTFDINCLLLVVTPSYTVLRSRVSPSILHQAVVSFTVMLSQVPLYI